MINKNVKLNGFLSNNKKNPNIKFNSFLKYNNNINLKNHIFEMYKSFQNNNIFIIIPNDLTQNIEIFTLYKNELQIYKQLKGQNYEISLLKYYINKNNEEYLLSTDILEQIFIWDISNDYILLQKIQTNYKYTMHSNLLLFTLNEKYIITTCCPEEPINNNNDDTSSKIYSVTNGLLIKNINGTFSNSTYYILEWYNLIDNNKYIIECCKGKIFIYNINKDELYIEFYNIIRESNFYRGFIYSENKNDYFLSGDDNGLIYLWNLTIKSFFRIIDLNTENSIKRQIFHIHQWNNKYFYVYEHTHNCIIIIDFKKLKKVSCLKFNKNKSIEDIKLINLPLYDKSFIISNEKGNFELWS